MTTPLPPSSPMSPSRKPSLSFASSPFSSSVALLPPPLRRRVTAAAAASSSHSSRFSLLFALLLFLVLILSFHVRDVVQKANKENRLLEYGAQLSEVSRQLRGVARDSSNLAELFRAARSEPRKKQKRRGPPRLGRGGADTDSGRHREGEGGSRLK